MSRPVGLLRRKPTREQDDETARRQRLLDTSAPSFYNGVRRTSAGSSRNPEQQDPREVINNMRFTRKAATGPMLKHDRTRELMKQSDDSSRRERERRDRAIVDDTLDGIDQDLLDAVSSSSSSDELAIKAARIDRGFEADRAKRKGLPFKKPPLRPVHAPMTQAQRKKADEEAKREERLMLKSMTKEQMIAYTLEQNPIKRSQDLSPSPSPSPVRQAPSKPTVLDSDDSDREPDLFSLVEGAFLDRGIDYRAIEEAEKQRLAELQQEREKWADVDLSAAAIALEDDGKVAPGRELCPFCDEVLPLKPSVRLESTIFWLSRRPHAKRRPTPQNPDAVLLPTSETIACCARHRAESITIPQGRKKGYPKTIDFAALKQRVKKLKPHLAEICKGSTFSTFLEDARRDFRARGGMKEMALEDEMATFSAEQPGYYGERGFEVIHAFLTKTFTPIDEPSKIREAARGVLTSDFFIRRVLVPETALLLIAEDMGFERDDLVKDEDVMARVKARLVDSRDYGVAVFGVDQREDEEVKSDEEDRPARRKDEMGRGKKTEGKGQKDVPGDQKKKGKATGGGLDGWLGKPGPGKNPASKASNGPSTSSPADGPVARPRPKPVKAVTGNKGKSKVVDLVSPPAKDMPAKRPRPKPSAAAVAASQKRAKAAGGRKKDDDDGWERAMRTTELDDSDLSA